VIKNAKCKMQNAKCKMQNLKCKIGNRKTDKFFFLLITSLTISCGPEFIGPEFYRKINNYTADESYDSAVNYLFKNREKFTPKSTLVYHMDMAMLLHLLGNYQESIKHVEASQKIIEDLYTRRISWETESILTSDLAIPYRGEGFEHLMLHVIGGFNFSMLGKYDEAAVEARRADARMKQMGAWGDDPFIRYITGVFFENDALINDAYISYALAWEIYKKHNAVMFAPASLVSDLMRTSMLMGFSERTEELRNIYPEIKMPKLEEIRHTGEILLVHMNGISPYKIEKIVEISIGKGMAFVDSFEVQSKDQKDIQKAMTFAKTFALGTNVTVSYPEIVITSPEINFSGINMLENVENEKILGSSEHAVMETFVISDLAAISKAYFDATAEKRRSRSIARIIVKFLLSMAAAAAGEAAGGEKWGWAVGLLAGGAAMAALGASESADTRSWRTLPAEIRLARLRIDPGNYNVLVRYYNKTVNDYGEREYENIKVSAGKVTFIVLRTM
jgi:tetratricopeptide (TPR) repeat protein